MKSLHYSVFLIISLFQIGVLHAQSHYDWWPIGRNILIHFDDEGPYFYSDLGLDGLLNNDPAYAVFSNENGALQLFGTEELVILGILDTIDLRIGEPHPSAIGGANQGNIIIPIQKENFQDTLILYYIYVINRGLDTIASFNFSMKYLTIHIIETGDTTLYEYSSRELLFDQLVHSEVHAVRHANGDDWWVIARTRLGPVASSNQFWVCRLTEEGFGEPILQELGLSWSFSSFGQMTFSPLGNQLALTTLQEIQIFDFDRCTGKLSNARIIEDSVFGHYGCAFSSDGSKLYVSTHIPKLFQYDLSTLDFAKTELLSGVGSGQSNFYEATQLQRGPDNRIYMGFRKFGFWPYPYGEDPSQYLMAVTNPNAAGVDVVLDTFAVWLGGFYNRSLGLPNFVNYNLGPLEGSDCDSTGGGSTFVENPGEIRSDWQVQPTVSSGLYVFSGPTNTILTAYDVWGRLVWRDTYSGSGIDLSAIPPGLYLLHASRESQQQMFKIIRQ